MNNNNKKSESSKKKGRKRVIDLTSYINKDNIQSDVNGSYTGITADTFFHGDYEAPVQDADDL